MRKLGLLLLLLTLLLLPRDWAVHGQKAPDQLPGLKDLLVGKWQALIDDTELMDFRSDGSCIMSVKGQTLGKASYQIVNRDMLVITSPDGDELERFTVQIVKDELSLIQTARFKRAK